MIILFIIEEYNHIQMESCYKNLQPISCTTLKECLRIWGKDLCQKTWTTLDQCNHCAKTLPMYPTCKNNKENIPIQDDRVMEKLGRTYIHITKDIITSRESIKFIAETTIMVGVEKLITDQHCLNAHSLSSLASYGLDLSLLAFLTLLLSQALEQGCLFWVLLPRHLSSSHPSPGSVPSLLPSSQ